MSAGYIRLDSFLARLDDLLGIDPAPLTVVIGHGDRRAVGLRGVGRVVDHIAGIDGLAAELGVLVHGQPAIECAAGDVALRGDRAVERAAGNISGSRVADFFDCDRPVEAAAGDYTLSISASHRAVIASAGELNRGGIHLAGVSHSQVRIEKGNVANGQRTTFHIQGIILRDGQAVQRQVAADARRLFQVFHVGDGKPAVVDQCAVHRQRSILSQRQQAGNCVFASGLVPP